MSGGRVALGVGVGVTVVVMVGVTVIVGVTVGVGVGVGSISGTIQRPSSVIKPLSRSSDIPSGHSKDALGVTVGVGVTVCVGVTVGVTVCVGVTVGVTVGDGVGGMTGSHVIISPSSRNFLDSSSPSYRSILYINRFNQQ